MKGSWIMKLCLVFMLAFTIGTNYSSQIEANNTTNAEAEGKLYAGRFFSAYVAGGFVYTWGINEYGQLGDGTTVQRNTPDKVKGAGGTSFLTDIVEITGGEWSMAALREDGTVWTWGRNNYGQLGNGTYTDSLTPVQVKGPNGVGFLENIQTIVSGYNHTMALSHDGTIWVWGLNHIGQLGDGTQSGYLGYGPQSGKSTPVQVKGPNGIGVLNNVTAIANLPHDASIALREDGTVWTWGWNGEGRLGVGSNINNTTVPTQVVAPNGQGFLSDVVAISGRHAIRADGTVWMWGYNANHELGNGSTTSTNYPVQITVSNGSGFLTDIVAVSGGDYHSISVKSDGTVWGWGWNGDGRAGLGSYTTNSFAAQVKGINNSGFLTDVKSISAGADHSLALLNDGTLVAWGRNTNGQLGDGTTALKNAPVQVALVIAPSFQYVYDANNRLIYIDYIEGTTAYRKQFVYDSNGNLLTVITTEQ